jgi:hypothetical protein
MVEQDNLFEIGDFTETFSGYDLNKSCVILNRKFNIKRPIVISIFNEKLLIKDYITNINNYFNWLNNCKEDLLTSFYNIVNSWTEKNITLDEIIKSNWYEELKIDHVMIYLSNSGVTGSRIYCFDKYKDTIDIFMHDNFIDIEYLTKTGFCKQYSNLKEVVKTKSSKNINVGICKIHKYRMKKIKVPILYGLPIGPIVGYEEDRKILFPNCDDEILGGCCINDSKIYRLKYICKLCNETRDKWKQEHSSEIFFHLQREIEENIIIVINKYEYLFNKKRVHDNYWVKVIAIPNGKYNIIAKSKLANEILSTIDIDLNNETLNLYIERDNDKIFLRIENKYKLDALWY